MTTNEPSIVSDQAKARHADGLWEIGEAADYLRCSVTSVRRYVKHGDLPHRRIAGRLLFIPSELVRWVERQQGQVEPERQSA